jgi:hypothetical protein
MIPETAQLHELPAYWREQIRKLKSENRALRMRLRAAVAELEARSK